MKYPDFACIGAQKAGTTWLYENLRLHPAFWLPFLKEVDYFNYVHIPAQRQWILPYLRERCLREIARIAQTNSPLREKTDRQRLDLVLATSELAQAEMDDDWYARVFAAAPSGAICGDITPEYSMLPPKGISHLLRLNPNVRILLLLRHPVDRDLSHARMLLKDEPEIRTSDLARVLRLNDVHSRSEYPDILTRWTALVPEDNLKIVFLDHIAARPKAILTEIAGFLGASTTAEDWSRATELIHAGRAIAIPTEIATEVRVRHSATLNWMAERYPDPCRTWLTS